MLKSTAIGAALGLALLSPAMAQDAPPRTDTAAATTDAAPAEVPQAVKDACKDDFEKHCKKHDPDSPAARDCMAGAFQELSDGCVTAILDSPLAEQPPQQLANSAEGERNGATAPAPARAKHAAAKHTAHGAQAAHNEVAHNEAAHNRVAHKGPSVTHAAHAAHAKQTPHTKYASGRTTHRVAQHASGSRRSVAAQIRRGTGIANYYVAKYTRFAFARVFR